MKILMVGNHFNDSLHNPNVWQELAGQLSAMGHAVLTTSGQSNKILRMSDMLCTIWFKRDQYQAAEVDVFSGQAFTWAFISCKLLEFLHKPFILTLHGGKLPVFSKKHPGMVSWMFSRASAVIAPSAYLADLMKKFREDIVIIPNGIALDRYPFIARNNLKPNLVWLRAFHEIYNPLMAVEVLGQVIKAIPEAKLTMIGPDKGDGSLQHTREKAIELNIEHAVQFVGRVPKSEVAQWLNTGDIFLNTTDYDNTPISVLEAMACGLCVVSTNVGGVPYLLENEVDSLLGPVKDIHAMTASVNRLLVEPGTANRLSVNGRHKLQNYDWSMIMPQWESVIENISRLENL